MKYLIDNDLHIHSFCSSCSRDENQTPDNILKYAKENNLSHICLTDHFWDETVLGASDWYKPQNYAHVSSALPLPQDKDVKFSFGCETDMDKFFTLGISVATMRKFDFIIVPTSHLHMQGFTLDKECVSVRDRAELYMKRNNALLDMDLPFHKMGLAHFTCSLMAYNSDGTHRDMIDLIGDDEFFRFFKRVARSGMGIELNMKLDECECESLLRPYRIAREVGCKFYLGSDAHGVSALNDAMERFTKMVNLLDLNETDKYTIGY